MSGAITPLPKYVFMAWCLVKHRDNFTFIIMLYICYSLKLLIGVICIYTNVVQFIVDRWQSNRRINCLRGCQMVECCKTPLILVCEVERVA